MESGSQVKRQKRRAGVPVWWSKERDTHQSWAAVWVCAFLTDSGASLFSVPGVFWVIVARRCWKYTTSVIGRCLFCCLLLQSFIFLLCWLQHANSCHIEEKEEAAFMYVINWRSVWNLPASGIHPLHNKPAQMPLSYLLLCHPNSDGSLFWWSIPVMGREMEGDYDRRERWTISEWKKGEKTGENWGRKLMSVKSQKRIMGRGQKKKRGQEIGIEEWTIDRKGKKRVARQITHSSFFIPTLLLFP